MVFDPNETSGHVPTRVMAVLENPDVQKLMHWEPDGKSFRVTNPDLFTESVLANHFKGVKFGSFQRSLQQWGFKTSGLKLNGRYVYYTFSHELFQRDQPDLCCSMQRVGMKAWKDGRSKRDHKGAEPETKPNHDDKTAELQNLQMNFAPPMHSVQPMFVPILQPVIFPPMEQFFMANQYPMFPVIPEMNPPPKPREVNRQAPKSKIQASKPQPRVSPRQSPKPTPIKEPCPEVKDDAEKSKISLTQDEVIAIIGITMLDGKN